MAKRKKSTQDKQVKSTEQTILSADKVITVTTSVEVTERIVDWNDIEARAEVDEYESDAPWEHADGWEHEARWLRRSELEHEEQENAQGYGWSYTNRENFLITLSDDTVRAWGFSDTEFYPGASKQVSRELFAAVKAKNLAQLVKWYTDGWQWYTAVAEYGDVSHNVGMIDSEEYAEEVAETELRGEVADELEAGGYIIVNRPEPDKWTPARHLRDKIRRNLAYAKGITATG